MRFYCEAYEVITEEKKVSFFYVDEKPLRYLLFDYIFLLVLAKKKYPNLMNCIVLAFILDIHIKCLRLLKCLKKYQI